MKFKNLYCLLLAFSLLLSSSGIAINIHYCGEEVASISINNDSKIADSEKNCCGEIEKKSHCCSDKILKLNQKSALFFSKAQLDFKKHFVSHEVLFQNFTTLEKSFVSVLKSTSSSYCLTNAPPRYLKFHQLLFYA